MYLSKIIEGFVEIWSDVYVTGGTKRVRCVHPKRHGWSLE